MTRRANAFVAKWKNEKHEKSASQSWWNDFFDVFGVDRYSTAVFERKARRASTGNHGSVDVFMPGVMIAEMKSFGKDGGKAEIQAEDYLAGGDITPAEMPRYIVSSDFNEIQITDLEAPFDTPIRFPIAKLPRYIPRFAFLSGYHAPVRSTAAQEAVSVKVAKEVGKLYGDLMGDLDPGVAGHDSEQAAIFMTRLLFLMYGDDADGLWEPRAFAKFINECTAEDGSDTGVQIAMLFQILDTPKAQRSARLDDRLAVFPHVNGGLFKDRVQIPTFDKPMRKALLKAMDVGWRDVSPAIFGSFFQGISSRAIRREQGEHYTSEANILKTLRPLFLDNLEERLQGAWHSAKELMALHEAIGKMQYFDPACGCGNFLIVAYRDMRDLELRLLERLRVLTGQDHKALDGTWELKVSPEQFGGIEINWWPAKIAETAMFLVDHQANQRMAQTLGSAPERLPITVAARIIHGNALRVDWNDVFKPNDSTYVFGNPPFIGQKEKTDEQTEDMKIAWGKRYDGYLDYVTGWHAKAINYLQSTKSARFAFVSTNSITQGQPVAALFQPILDEGWRIAFAHRTFAWSSEASQAAAVHCVIVGFDKGKASPRLFDYEKPKSAPVEVAVQHINPYLIDGPDVFVTKRSNPISKVLPPVDVGSKALDWKNLTVLAKDYDEVSKDPVILKYLRPFIGGDELINNIPRWCIWLKNLETSDLNKSRALQQRIKNVQTLRENSDDAGANKAASTPHLFQNDRQPDGDYLAIPNTFSENRRYMTVGRLPVSTIAAIKLFTAPDPDGFLFAVISSSMAITWQKMVGGRIKSDPSFSNTLVWNNFPFPDVTTAERQSIITAGKRILEVRESGAHTGKSLSDLYHPLNMPPELVKAHDALDREIDRAFGFSKVPSESQRQEYLFARYLEMTELGKIIKTEKSRKKSSVSRMKTH